MLKILKKEKNVQFAGSIHHPELAIKSEAITKEELDRLKKEKELKEKDKNKANENLVTVNAQIDSFSKKMKKEFSGKTDIKGYIEDVKKKYLDLQKSFEESSQTIKDLYYEIENKLLDINHFDFDEFKEKYDSEKIEHSKKITELNTKKEEFNKSIALKTKEQEQLKLEYEEAYKKLGFENEEVYKSNIMDEKTIESTKKVIEDYKQKFEGGKIDESNWCCKKNR